MRANTRHQLREWRWVGWFLTIGWWYLPIVFTAWVLWMLVKIMVVAINWIIEEVKWISKS